MPTQNDIIEKLEKDLARKQQILQFSEDSIRFTKRSKAKGLSDDSISLEKQEAQKLTTEKKITKLQNNLDELQSPNLDRDFFEVSALLGGLFAGPGGSLASAVAAYYTVKAYEVTSGSSIKP